MKASTKERASPAELARKHLDHVIQRTRSQIQFRQISTLSGILHSLGIVDEQETVAWKQQVGGVAGLDRVITPKEYNTEIVPIIEEKFKYEQEKEEKIRSVKEWEDNYVVEDWIRESCIDYMVQEDKQDASESEEASQLAHRHSKREPWEDELDSILPPPNPKQTAVLFAHQRPAARLLYYNLIVKKHRANFLQAAVGTGKTFIFYQVLRWMYDNEHHLKSMCLSPWPYLIVTAANVIEQTVRVGQMYFDFNGITDIKVTNYDALRNTLGSRFIRETKKVEDGVIRRIWSWIEPVNPCVIIWDESQKLKNESSEQSQIGQAFNNIKAQNTLQIFSSATAGVRPIDFKCMVVACRVPYWSAGSGLGNTVVTNENWSDWIKRVASPAAPEEHSPAAVERLIKTLMPWIVDVKNVRPQFKAINKTQMIDFQSNDERQAYNLAWERYLEEKAKLDASDTPNSRFMILVEFLKFRQAAELIRAPHYARAMYETVTQRSQAAVCALNFKATIAKIAVILHQDYNVSRDNISLIWGGDASLGGKESKYTEEEIKKILSDAIRNHEEIPTKVLKEIQAQLQRDSAGLGEIPSELRLGIQSRKERQNEIDKFQSGKSLYCLFSFKSGGVGLSLHHSDELTEQKCRRKPSGYVFEEDIKNISTRQRVTFLAPTYSAIELVQGLGRAPRLTSLSDTPQTIIFYRGTIEERVAAIVSQKLRCLKKVVRAREEWESAIWERGKHADDTLKQIEDAARKEAPVDVEDDSNVFEVQATVESEDEEE